MMIGKKIAEKLVEIDEDSDRNIGPQVGVGEASYSTIAPALISDLFVKDVRSRVLAVFYFAIPLGIGVGYMVGSGRSHVFIFNGAFTQSERY
jgi:MFS family permease